MTTASNDTPQPVSGVVIIICLLVVTISIEARSLRRFFRTPRKTENGVGLICSSFFWGTILKNRTKNLFFHLFIIIIIFLYQIDQKIMKLIHAIFGFDFAKQFWTVLKC